jgi:hypothetical protein
VRHGALSNAEWRIPNASQPSSRSPPTEGATKKAHLLGGLFVHKFKMG